MCSKAVWLFSDVADLSQFAISSDRILCSFDTNNSFCVSRDLHALMIRASVIFIPSHLHLNNSGERHVGETECWKVKSVNLE